MSTASQVAREFSKRAPELKEFFHALIVDALHEHGLVKVEKKVVDVQNVIDVVNKVEAIEVSDNDDKDAPTRLFTATDIQTIIGELKFVNEQIAEKEKELSDQKVELEKAQASFDTQSKACGDHTVKISQLETDKKALEEENKKLKDQVALLEKN